MNAMNIPRPDSRLVEGETLDDAALQTLMPEPRLTGSWSYNNKTLCKIRR